MQTSFTIAITAVLASFALASPTARTGPLTARQNFVCSAGSPQCCSVDVLGIADLNCAAPPQVPTSASNFTAICAAIGQIDMCCDIPILGQALLCNSPTGA